MPGFLMLDAQERGIQAHMSAWVVQSRGRAVLVEAGPGTALPLWLEALPAAGIRLESIEWILLTHIHLDHAGATGALLRHLPNARVGVHPSGVRHLVNPERLLAQAEAVWGSEFPLFGPMEPVPAERVVALEDGDRVVLDRRGQFRVMHTPGHAPHHISFFEESTRGIFPGDALGAMLDADGPFGEPWSMPGVAPPMADLPTFLRTARRIAELSPHRIYASHFGLWEPAMPHVLAATGQTCILWDLCQEVHQRGGSLQDAQERVYAMLATPRRTNIGEEQLRKESNMVTEAAWNYVARR